MLPLPSLNTAQNSLLPEESVRGSFLVNPIHRHMKRITRWSLVAALGFLCLAALPSQAQNIGTIPGKAKTAAAGLVVSYENGKSTVVYEGRKVFEGATKAKASGAVKNVNGVQYAAAFDGDKVIWENVKGAGSKVK